MSFKFKKLNNDIGKLDLSIRDIKKEFIKSASDDAERLIVGEIKRGFSPVASYGKFDAYSESYKKAILAGRVMPKTEVRPVDLTVSGQMLNTFKVSKTSKSIVMEFTDKIAKYHNDLGAGASKVIRKMLPSSGEKFKKTINDDLLDLLKQAVETVVAKLK